METQIINNNFNFKNIPVNFKLGFKGSSSLTHFYSQAAQDIFVLIALNGKKNGKFLDIGASEPQIINNTYLLETNFNWRGILIEIDKKLASKCKKYRKSPVICEDATKINYEEIFKKLEEVDYLSLDIDKGNLNVLNILPLEKYKIKVITFEHDVYGGDKKIQIESRKIFNKFGYERICEDVANGGKKYEDWYVHPDLVDVDYLKILRSKGQDWPSIMFNYKVNLPLNGW